MKTTDLESSQFCQPAYFDNGHKLIPLAKHNEYLKKGK